MTSETRKRVTAKNLYRVVEIEIAKLRLERGDILLFKVPADVPHDGLLRMSEQLNDMLRPTENGFKLLVFTSDTEVTVVKPPGDER